MTHRDSLVPLRLQPTPLVPLLAADDDLTPAIERALSAAARAARDGNAAARDALYAALEVKIARFVARHRWSEHARHGPHRDGRPWHAEDLAQDAFPIFADLLTAWPADDGFGRYFFAYFPWRLHDAARRYARPWRVELAGTPADLRLLLLADDSAAAAEALALLEVVAAHLPPPVGDLLRWRVRDGEPVCAIAHRLGLSPRTVRRRWRALLADLAASFDHRSGEHAPAP